MSPGPADFVVHPSSGVPIHRQLADQVRAMVAGGVLKPGDLLPSVRALAGALEVNPMTVSKAWSRLEADGDLVRLRGRGMAVAETKASAGDAPLEERRADLRPLLQQAVVRARQLRLTDRQTVRLLEDILKEIPRD